MSEWRGGHAQNRFGQRGMIAVFVGLFVILSAVAVLIAVLREPPGPKPVCPNNKPCANPPRGGPPTFDSSSPALVLNQVFQSAALGFRLEYPSVLEIGNETPTGISLLAPSGVLAIVVTGAEANQESPPQMIQARINSLKSSIPDLQEDNDGSVEILDPSVGFHAGVGGFYRGDVQSPSGIEGPVDVALMAATDGKETLSVTVVSTNRSETPALFGASSSILDTVRFQGDVVQ
jgi:hypothetical protein